MSNFMDTAKAVDPIITMLNAGGCKYPTATIFDDGSGHITVHVDEADEANRLMLAHGVDLRADGYPNIDRRDDYDFTFDLDVLKKYSESLCPHCGKDTEVPK